MYHKTDLYTCLYYSQNLVMGRKGTHLTCRQKNLLLVSLKSWQTNQIEQKIIISPGTIITTFIVQMHIREQQQQTKWPKQPTTLLSTQLKCSCKNQNLQRPNFLLPTWLFHWHYGHSCRGSMSYQVAVSVSLQKKAVSISRVIDVLGALPEEV